MRDYKPKYLQMIQNGEFQNRVDVLNEKMESCTICPHHCHVNRLKNEKGICRAGSNMIINSFGPHLGEESVLVGRGGSGTIFFSYCNLQCVFCQNYGISHQGKGYEVSPGQLAKIMLSLQERGCHNINLVSPSHFVSQIVEGIGLAAKAGLSLPIIYNTGAYDDIEILKLLDGIIDIYMPDIKFANNQKAQKYTGARNYFDVATRAVQEMFRQVGNLKLDSKQLAYRGLLIRHLVMPNNLADTKIILKFVSEKLSRETALNIMSQYHPANKAFNYPELSKRVSHEEYLNALTSAKALGLSNLI